MSIDLFYIHVIFDPKALGIFLETKNIQFIFYESAPQVYLCSSAESTPSPKTSFALKTNNLANEPFFCTLSLKK